MTIKTTIALSEDHLRYAEKLVENGHYPSISSVIEAGLEQMMAAASEQDPVSAMAVEINRRMELPRDQWISMDDDNVFDEVKRRLKERYGSR
jgi:antitoxin ParD1/3/4